MGRKGDRVSLHERIHGIHWSPTGWIVTTLARVRE
jgi:hypothetical protein